MAFEPEELSPEEVTEQVDSVIEDNEVVLFMKGNELMPQCGYSRRRSHYSQYVDEFETVDVLPALPHYREALEAKATGRPSPRRSSTASSSAAVISSNSSTSAANSKKSVSKRGRE